MSEKNRYSDDELQEFKLLILDKLEKAQKDYVMYKSSITQSDGNDTQDTSPTFKVLKKGLQLCRKRKRVSLHSVSRNLFSICKPLWYVLRIKPMAFAAKPGS
jgi:hypothetical protein